MLTATPPAYYQEFEKEESRQGPRGASSDSTQIDEISKRAFQHLISTPRHYVEFEQMGEEYNPPIPTSVTRKRVRFRYVGPGKPLPLEEDNDDA